MDCYKQNQTSVVDTILEQVVTEDSNITALEEGVEAEILFVIAMDVIGARTKKMIWEAPPELSPAQSSPSNFTHFLSNCFKASSLFKMANRVPLPR